MANKLASVMLMMIIPNRIPCHWAIRLPNTLYSNNISTKTAEPLETTERYEVTLVGAPSYTSAAHRWKGTSEILKNNPTMKNTKAIICSALAVMCGGISVK